MMSTTTIVVVEDNIAQSDITEQLRASKQQFSNAFTFAAVGMALTAPDGHFLQVNPALCQMLGYSEEALRKCTFQDITHPDDLGDSQEHLRKLISGDSESFQMEKRYLHHDGHLVWAHLSISLVRDDTRQPVHFVALIQDITKRKQAEQELQAVIHLSAVLNRISQVLHGTLNAQKIMEQVVIEGATALGSETATISLREGDLWRVSHVYGMPDAMVGERMTDDQERHALLAITSREPVAIVDGFTDPYVNLEHHCRHTIHSVLVVPLIIHDQPFGVISFQYHTGHHCFTDGEKNFARQLATTTSLALENAQLFSERQRADEVLRQSEERLRLALDAGSMATWNWDITTGTHHWNDELYRLLGFEPRAIEPNYKDWARRIFPQDLLRVESMLRKNLEQGGELHIEHRMLGRGDSVRWVEAHGRAQHNALGQPIRSYGIVIDITERKRAEEERTYMMESAYCLLWNATVKDVGNPDSFSWQIVYISDELAQRFLPLDIKPGQTYGTAFYLARPEEDRARCNPEANKNISLGRSYTQEFRVRAADGSMHWLHESIQVEVVEPGKVWHLVGVCVDITDQKAAEEALRKSEERLQLGVYVAGLGIAEIDYTNDAVLLTPEAAALFGLPPDNKTLSRDAIHDLFHPAERPALQQRIDEVLNPESDGWFAMEHRVIHPDHQVRWLSVRKQIIFDRSVTPARPLRGLLVAMDITERKEAEIALREEKELLSKITVTVPGTIISYYRRPDGTTAFSYASPNIREIYGVTPEELVTDPSIVVRRRHPDDAERVQQALEESQRTLTMFHTEFRVMHPEKGVMWIEARTMPTREPDGTTLWYGYLADVTERKHAEEAVIQLNAELEDRVAQRTAELALAKDEAEQANKAKSEFLSRMSHELRTPLNAILGFGQVLDRRNLDVRSKESVGYILKGGRHLLNLINEVLDIARVEAGRLELSLEPIDLSEIVSEVCALVSPLATERDIQLKENQLEQSHPYVLADRQRFKQVLLNILSNAIKYNKDGGLVTVSAHQKRDGWVTLAIRDTGQGIAARDLQKLFTPFERLSASNSGIEGSGLGLVLSNHLMKAMGGNLGVESVVGQGTTFDLELPQADFSGTQSALLPEDRHDFEPDSAVKHQYTVLYIEDSPSNLRLVETFMQHLPGTTLITARDGTTGLELARHHEPDLILLDLNQPDMLGNEVLIRLQRSAITRDIPVIIVSTDATPNQLEQLMATGATAYLTKPLNRDQLLHTVNRYLGSSRPR